MKGRIIVTAIVLGSVLVPAMASGAFGILNSSDRVQLLSPRGNSLTDSINSLDTFIATVNAGASSVAAGDTLSGHEYWGAGVGNENVSAPQSGAQVTFDTQSTGVKMDGWGFSYFNPNSEGGFGIIQSTCPAPSTYSETCPATGATLPTGGSVWAAGFPGLSDTYTPGFDSSLSVGPVGANGDAAVTASVALNNPRYEGSNKNLITIWTSTDNADESAIPTFTSNGSPVPLCPQPIGTACAAPVEWASYQYSPPGGGNSVPCNSVQMEINQVPYSGAVTPFQLKFQENEKGTGSCPIGNPGLQVAVNNADASQATPCALGTDCSATVPLAGFGTVTASVGSGQGVSGFLFLPGTQYNVIYPASNASPPPGAASTVSGSSITPGGNATAIDGSTTVEAQNGTGVVLVSQFNSNPVSSPPLGSNGNYFDVQLASGSTFSGVSVLDCNSNNNTNNTVDTLEWWNGSGWLSVTDSNGNSVKYNGNPPCASVVLNAMTSPTINQLTGTVFAVAATVAQATLTITSLSGIVGRALVLTTSGGSGNGALTYRVKSGSARGCSIVNNVLRAASSGTCFVTVRKAGDGSYTSFTSGATKVNFSAGMPKVAPSVTVQFSTTNSFLSAVARQTLTALVRHLMAGQSVIIVGYAKGNAKLAERRATSVANFLTRRVAIHVIEMTATKTNVNQVTVTTKRR